MYACMYAYVYVYMHMYGCMYKGVLVTVPGEVSLNFKWRVCTYVSM